jgi:hypothetical protein
MGEIPTMAWGKTLPRKAVTSGQMESQKNLRARPSLKIILGCLRVRDCRENLLLPLFLTRKYRQFFSARNTFEKEEMKRGSVIVLNGAGIWKAAYSDALSLTKIQLPLFYGNI